METLYLIPLLIAAGVAAQWIAAAFRLPPLLLLLGTGVVLGPIAGIVSPEEHGDSLRPFIALAVSIVLFEGGLSLHLHEARHVGTTLWRLIGSGLVLGFLLTFAVATTVGGLTAGTAAVLAAILVVTGPTVIIPMLRGARISLRPAALLKWEGIVNDPLGVLLAYFALQASRIEPGEGIATLAFRFLGASLLASLLGLVVGWILARALASNRIAEHLRSPVILASVLMVYALSEPIQHESGFLAVTLMGLVLGNTRSASVHDIRAFKEQVTTLLVSVLFVVLSARLDLADVEAVLGRPLLVVAAVLFVVRPIVVLIATYRTVLPWKERVLVGWIAPRGVVAAAMAGAFAPDLQEAGYTDAALLEPIVFGVIVCTVVLHGLTIRPLARATGLAATPGSGILIAGVSRWSVALAQALRKAGADVVMTDNRYRRVSHARMEGVDVHYGNVLEEESTMELPMEKVSWVLAATDEDAYNSLVCMHFVSELGRERVLQLTPLDTETGEQRHRMMGRKPWGEDGTYDAMTRRFWRGGEFKVTSLSANFGFDELRTKNPGAVWMFAVQQRRLQVLDKESQPGAGAKVVYLVSASDKVAGTTVQQEAFEQSTVGEDAVTERAVTEND